MKKILLILFTVIFTIISCEEVDEPTYTVPTLTTNVTTDIAFTSATSGGDITETGGADITAKGVCWSTSTNPTTEDNITNDGTEIGSFTSTITGLTEDTTYYVKAYATNSEGTAYGEELEFTTLLSDSISTVTTTSVTDIALTSATSGGNLTDDGGSTVTAKGICWNTSPNPTTADNTTDEGTAMGSFTSAMTDLTENTTYYVRAYATNGEGTAYGEELEFTTLVVTSISTVTTTAITDITATSVTSGGNVTDDGYSSVTAKGVCWSPLPEPTIADYTTNDGTGTGAFTSQITGLTAYTTYYVRAYAINGEGIAYGEELTFMAENIFPGEKISIESGSFQMGSDAGGANEQPMHNISISSFEISKYEVTNQQYADYMNLIGANVDGSVDGTIYLDIANSDCQISYNGSSFVVNAGKTNNPVIEVSWDGAKAYSEYYGGRLPTEAEWEFAALGGNDSNGYSYAGSDNIDEVAWYTGNSGGTTHSVGTKNANELGLYDMSGNVWEWTNDWYDENYYNTSSDTDPQGPETGTYRVFRGGSWFYNASYSRVAFRNGSFPTYMSGYLGFRPVFTP